MFVSLTQKRRSPSLYVLHFIFLKQPSADDMTGDVYMISNSATHFGIWKRTFVNNHYNIFGNLEIIIIHCWKVKIVAPSLTFINYLSDLSSVGNNIVDFLKEDWLGNLKMSLLLTVGGQKAEKLKLPTLL